MPKALDLTPENIKGILLQIEPSSEDIPEHFLRVICDQAAKAEAIEIAEEGSGDHFLTWDEIKHIGEVASIIATCIRIYKDSHDIATTKSKLPPSVADHPVTDKVLNSIEQK
jgi:hypothetical protein